MDEVESKPHRRFFHVVLVVSDILGRIAPLAISPALAAIAAISAWPWRHPALQVAIGLLTLLAISGDGVSLALLPRRGRSYGPATPPLLALALLRAALIFLLGVLWPTWAALVLAVCLQLALTAAHFYATWIEPFRLRVVRLDVPGPDGDAPLRILHISDIHFEGWTPRERRLLEVVQELSPDLIFLTGDYLNLSSVRDPAAHAGVRDLLASLSVVAPTYAITGSPPVDLRSVVPAIFAGLPITWLVDRIVEVEAQGRRFRLVGLRCTREREADWARLRRLLPDGASNGFTVLLYHSPDLFLEAASLRIDLYLAGHTHGGQIRLPFFGALITSSDFWKRYEGGVYRRGATTMVVSRGLGMEGLGAPRARFLCPPEIVLLTISPCSIR